MLAILVASALHGGFGQARTLNVFAAASLKEAFTTIARNYEAGQPGLSIRLNFAGSQTLAAQINQGAPADVFASAAEKNLRDVSFDPASLRIFVLNRLELAVRKGLDGIRSVRDLAMVKNLVVADPAVPVGHYTEVFLAKAAGAYGASWLSAVRSHIVSREQDVKAVLAKVRLGEADAGIVYVSDVATARGLVNEVPIPAAFNETAEYPAAIPVYAEHREDAKHFIKYLLSDDSQKVFEACGFVSPTRAAAKLDLVLRGRVAVLPLPLSRTYPQLTVDATDEHKRSRKFRGVAVTSLFKLGQGASATFVGADRYAQTVSTSDLRARKAVLVRGSDGNYQLIVPGLKPSVWVNWVRRIELR